MAGYTQRWFTLRADNTHPRLQVLTGNFVDAAQCVTAMPRHKCESTKKT